MENLIIAIVLEARYADYLRFSALLGSKCWDDRERWLANHVFQNGPALLLAHLR